MILAQDDPRANEFVNPYPGERDLLDPGSGGGGGGHFFYALNEIHIRFI